MITINPCNVRTVLVAVGFYLIGAGELELSSMETLLGAVFPTVAGLWKAWEVKNGVNHETH